MKMFLLLFLISCGLKPEKETFDSKIESVKEQGKLWVALRKQANGELVEINFTEGGVSKNVMPLHNDVRLSISRDRLHILTRMNSDSMQLIDKDGNVEETPFINSEIGMNQSFNPQSFLFDEGRYLVVGQNSNYLRVYEKGLLTQSIDLNSVKKDNDPFLEPVFIFNYQGKIGILLQRLSRSTYYWTPEEESGLILLDKETLDIKSIEYLKIRNPLMAYEKDEDLIVLSAGNFLLEKNQGAISKFEDFESIQSVNLPYKIYDAKIVKEKVYFLASADEKKETCIFKEEKAIKCFPGKNYMFSTFEITPKHIFLGYNNNGSGEVWTLTLKGDVLEKTSFAGTIMSLVWQNI